MRSFKPLVVVALLSCAAAGVRAQQQFTLLASIVDPATNASPEKIDAGELRVLEDGVTGKVLRVDAVDRVVKVQVLVDNGAGVGSESIADLRKGLRSLIETLPPGVETSIYTTAPQARPLVRPTSDRAALLKGVDLLTPDRTTGLFTESLGEAAQRATKEKEDVFTVIISAASSAGDNNVQDRDIQRAFDRIQSRPMIVHVLLYSGGPARASGGIVQTQVGLAVPLRSRGFATDVAGVGGVASRKGQRGKFRRGKPDCSATEGRSMRIQGTLRMLVAAASGVVIIVASRSVISPSRAPIPDGANGTPRPNK